MVVRMGTGYSTVTVSLTISVSALGVSMDSATAER